MNRARTVGGEARRPARGASGNRNSLSNRLKSWLHHHRSSARDAWQKMRLSPVQSGMTALVIAIALALPAALYVAVGNLQQLSAGIESSAQLTLYLKAKTDQQQIDKLQRRLKAHNGVGTITFISAEQALAEFQSLSGLGEALSLLDQNPLPAVFMVQPTELASEPEAVSAMVEEFRGWPQVDDVRLDMKWVQRLHALLQVGRRIALALGLALALGVLLVIGNTIRLAVQNRRDEIVVVKLVGGTDGYVRRPFLYTGLWYGVAGGLLAWLLVWSGMHWLNGSVAQLSSLYQSGFSLSGLGFSELLSLLMVGAALGLCGAWIAVGKHLREIEPT